MRNFEGSKRVVHVGRSFILALLFLAFHPALADDRIAFEAVLTVDAFANVRGGLETGTAVHHNVDLTCELDLDALAGFPDATLFLYGLGNGGDSPSELVGDLQTLSNIDTPETWLLYEAWLEQSLFDGRFSWKLGLYDVNSEFDATESGGLFLNSSHGVGPDFAQSGVAGPSIFPVTSLALRLRTQSERFYVQAVTLDAVPGHPEKSSGTHVRLSGDEGLLTMAELGLLGRERADDLPRGKLALGVWRYSEAVEATEFAAGTPGGTSATHNDGVYVVGETTVGSGGLSLFGRFGVADDRVNQLDAYVGFGGVLHGVFARRPEDQLGLAVAHAHTADAYREAFLAESAETAVELTYRAPVGAWLVLQGDVQWIRNPGADPTLDDALAFGLRLELSGSRP